MVGLAALFIGVANAEQLHGVEVYPGAKPEPSTNQFLKEGLKMNGGAFVTGDSVEKVVAFYGKQPGLKQMPGADAKQAGFTGKGVHVTIQNPWLEVKQSKMMNNTLISIVQQK
jgi:hypothetical protein